MPFCIECGTEYSRGKFCSGCGAQQEVIPAPEPQSSQAPLASSPLGSPDISEWLNQLNDENGARKAISKEDCPVEVMEKAIELFPDIERQVVYNKNTPSHILEQVFESASLEMTRSTIVKHSNASPAILHKALTDPSEDVRESLAEVTSEPSFLTTLAQDDSMHVKFNVARNPHTPTEALKLLLDPYLPNVAAGVLANPNCTLNLFKTVAANPVEKGWITDPLLAFAPQGMIEECLAKVPQSERFYLFKNPNASEELILQALKDAETIYDQDAIRALLKRENLSEEILLEAIEKVSENNLHLLTNYKFLTKKVVEKLVTRLSIDSVVSLIQNPTVPGEFLMPLIKHKSKKVQNALREKTYVQYSADYKTQTQETYIAREGLWAALSGGTQPFHYKVSLILAGDPFTQDFDADWISGWDSPEPMLENDDNSFDAFPCILFDQLEDFRKSPLGELLEADGYGEQDSNGLVNLQPESYGFKFYKHEDTADGGWSVLYGKNTEVSFTVEARSLEQAREISITNAAKYLRVCDGAGNSEIYQISGTVRLNHDLIVTDELWYTNKETEKYIRSWPK